MKRSRGDRQDEEGAEAGAAADDAPTDQNRRPCLVPAWVEHNGLKEFLVDAGDPRARAAAAAALAAALGVRDDAGAARLRRGLDRCLDAFADAPARCSSAPALAPLDVKVDLGPLVFLDRVEWDLSRPAAAADAYAAAAAAELGLGWAHAARVAAKLRQRVAAAREAAAAGRLAPAPLPAPRAAARAEPARYPLVLTKARFKAMVERLAASGASPEPAAGDEGTPPAEAT